MIESLPTDRREGTDLSWLAEEYRQLIDSLDDPDDEDACIDALIHDLAWTAPGAHLINMLARRYGQMILRNALALAEAAEIEDGTAGF